MVDEIAGSTTVVLLRCWGRVEDRGGGGGGRDLVWALKLRNRFLRSSHTNLLMSFNNFLSVIIILHGFPSNVFLTLVHV